MSGQRVLLPTPTTAGDSRPPDATRADGGGPIAARQGGPKQRRHRHTAQEWEDVKESFKALYVHDETSLGDVKREMETLCGFEARYVRCF